MPCKRKFWCAQVKATYLSPPFHQKTQQVLVGKYKWCRKQAAANWRYLRWWEIDFLEQKKKQCLKNPKQQNISHSTKHPSQPKIKQDPKHHVFPPAFTKGWVLSKHRQNRKPFLLHTFSWSEHGKLNSLSRHTSVWQKEVFPGSVTPETEGFPGNSHLDEGSTWAQNKHILHLGSVWVPGWRGKAGDPLMTASPECCPLLSS